MNKRTYSIRKPLRCTCAAVAFLCFNILLSQIPSGYYASAEGYAGQDLKYQLNQIIDNQTEFPYTASTTDIWDILKETDKDPNNPDNVILLYSGVSVDAAQEYNNGNGWTREHVWAKSRGDFGTTLGPGTDAHHLRPLDNTTNTARNNRVFDNCVICEVVYDKWGNDTGSKIDANVYTFEPRDAVKGDVARMLFYMAVRYEGYDGYPDLEFTESILDQSDKSPVHGKLSTLLQWNRDDPVDGWEVHRNDIIYYNYQHNRNPFIDHPELAEYLWGNKTIEIWGKTLSVDNKNNRTVFVYPNPASNYITVKGLTNTVYAELYDSLGRRLLDSQINQTENKIDVSHLNGIFILRLISANGTITKRIIINN